jgi:hypothetical protein
MQTAFGALKLLSSCAEVPPKSIRALRAARSTRIATRSARRCPADSEGAVLQRADHAAHRLFRVVLHVRHERDHHVAAELRDHPRSSSTPFWFAAICARRSAMFCSTLRAG